MSYHWTLTYIESFFIRLIIFLSFFLHNTTIFFVMKYSKSIKSVKFRLEPCQRISRNIIANNLINRNFSCFAPNFAFAKNKQNVSESKYSIFVALNVCYYKYRVSFSKNKTNNNNCYPRNSIQSIIFSLFHVRVGFVFVNQNYIKIKPMALGREGKSLKRYSENMSH